VTSNPDLKVTILFDVK